jgi:hypothetical protein
MPQVSVNSVNVKSFGFAATFKSQETSIFFDTSALTVYQTASNAGAFYVQGICFKVIDQEGNVLVEPNWTSPQIRPNLLQTTYTLNLQSIGIDFYFQSYKLIGYLKDANGVIYETTPIVKKICKPNKITSAGSVGAVFQIIPKCAENLLMVKDLTNFTYNNLEPISKVKTGTLFYPTGTIAPIPFTNTPFTNNKIYNGEYRVSCTTICTYDIKDDVYVSVKYYINSPYGDVECANRLNDVLCCIADLNETKRKNCNTSVGARAQQQ